MGGCEEGTFGTWENGRKGLVGTWEFWRKGENWREVSMAQNSLVFYCLTLIGQMYVVETP